MTTRFTGGTDFELCVKCNTQARMQHNRELSVQTSQHQISEKYGKKHRRWRQGLPLYRVSIKSFPDYKHLLQENYVE